MTWVTEINHVVAPTDLSEGRIWQFVDEQRLGPFRFWHHLNRSTPTADGVEMEDVVHYVMPWGWLGRLVHRVFVERRLRNIFDYRRDYLGALFEQRSS
jgi:ligand-binding SRPBCC domain-containing protein